MGGTLVGVAYVWLAQLAAFLLMPRGIAFGVRARALAFWAISAPVVLLFQPPIFLLLSVAALMLVLSPMRSLDRAAFFFVAVPAVPVFISTPLPFPGINYLTDLSHFKLAALVVLMPVLMSRRESGGSGVVTGPAILLLVYVVYATILITASNGITGGMRYALDQVLVVVLPYFAVMLTLRKPEDADKFYQAFLIASLILATVALLSSFKRWDIYAASASLITEIRDGAMRINATAGTHSLAFHLAAAVIVLEFLRHRISIGWVHINIMRLVLLAGMLTTGSRGALGGLVVAGCVYALFVIRSAPLRTLLLLTLVVGSVVWTVWLVEGNVNAYDEHGTFIYRQELFWTSANYILQYPFFGDRNFLQSGMFDHLLQGQGIIDVTNLYLQVALTFGLVGLALFACVFVLPALSTGLMLFRLRRTHLSATSARNSSSISEQETWFRAAAVAVACSAGWLFLVATTSDVGLTVHLGIFFAAACHALKRTCPVEVTSATAVPNAQGVKNPYASA